MSISTINTYRWSRKEYEKIVNAGIFHPEERVELVDGLICTMTPQNSLHATALQLTGDALRRIYSSDYTVRVQMPLALDHYSEPEPDIAVVKGNPRNFRDEHPTSAVLIIEVADSSLSYDREHKQRLYARTGIMEYWIVNLIDFQLEVFRKPEGESYLFKKEFFPGQAISPLMCLQESIEVEELFP